MSDTFFQDLEPVDSFDACLDGAVYRDVPSDWVVMLSDVRESTAAIRDGHYKAVNMVGAATITAILNISSGIELPFVFGGDGGAIVVPASLAELSKQALVNLQAACTEKFGLGLRVGAIPVSQLRASGHPLRVCKYQLSPNNYLGFFFGSSLDYATEILKNPQPNPEIHLTELSPQAPPNLSGLSCRWEPLKSQRGSMMTLLIQPLASASGQQDSPQPNTASNPSSAIITEIAHLLGGNLTDFAPANRNTLRLKWPPQGLQLEASAMSRGSNRLGAYAATLISSLVQLIAERFNIKIGPYDARLHRQETASNTDYRKLDGVIHFVLDITPDQDAAIRRYLESSHRSGSLQFGAHSSDAALMTCLVFDLATSKHIHFIDGAGGGHTLAALDFKQRLAA